MCSSARSRDNLDEWLDRFDIATAGLLPGESGLAIHVALISLHALILVSLATLLVELDLARAPRDDGSAPSSLGATLAPTLRNTVGDGVFFFPDACRGRPPVRFDLTTLKLFVSAIDHGSIASAAEREHIVASAASKRIGDLETGLGVALLIRQHAGVVPTAAGEALARYAREVIKTLDRIPDALSTLAADDQLDIRMLANQTAVVVVVADLASYIGRQPAVKIRLEEGHSLAIIESVAQGSADIGIIGHFQPTDRLQVVPYRSIPLMLVMPASHPLASRLAVSFAQALEFDLITLVQGTAIRGWALAAAARLAHKPKFTMQVQSYEAMRAMIHAGLGIAVMPAPNILPYEDLLQVRALPLTDDWACMQLYLVCDRRTAGIPAIAELLAHLTAA